MFAPHNTVNEPARDGAADRTAGSARVRPAGRAPRMAAGAVLLALGLASLAGVAITLTRTAIPSADAATRRPVRSAGLQQVAGTTCITPDRDATVDSERPTETLGAEPFLRVARGRAVPPTQRISYLHFPTSTLPSPIELVSASLRLILEDSVGIPPFSQSVHAVTGGWDEYTVTWSNRPRVTGALVNTAFGGQTITVTADVSLLVRNWLDGTWPNHGLTLEPDSDFDEVWFFAREYEDPPHPPVLCVEWRLPTATPEPTATPDLRPTATPSPRPSDTPRTPTDTATPLPTDTPRGSIATATATPLDTPTNGATVTATPAPSRTTAPSATSTVPPTATSGGPPTATPTEGASALDLTVTDPGDEPDSAPGDGFCRTSSGRCTLRAALGEAGRHGATDVRISFDARVTSVRVSAALPLPSIQRANVSIDGALRPSALGRGDQTGGGTAGIAGGAETEPLTVAQSTSMVRIIGSASGPPSSVAGLVLDGARGIVIDGLVIEGFHVGIAILNRTTGVAIGAAGGGAQGNHLERNTFGVAVDASSTDILVNGNAFARNLEVGAFLARTAGGRVRLTGNRFANNRSAAIGVGPGGAETAPPVVTNVDGRIGIVTGTACPGCRVELFADPGVQAARVLHAAATADSTGRWVIRGLVFLPADTNVTATATQGEDTSRLSAAFPTAAGVAWTLSERPGASPGALRNRQLVRRYVLRDERRVPVPSAFLRFVDDDLGMPFPVRNGIVDVSVPVELAAALFSRKLHTSLEAVELPNGPSGAIERHSVRWSPNLAVAVAQPDARPGDVLFDILGLGPLGLGARHRLATALSAASSHTAVNPARAKVADRVGGRAAWPGAAPFAALQGNADAYAAAYIGAPAELREGPYAWTQNIAAGGGIYQLEAGSTAVAGPLEIVAPVAAYNAAGAASGCPGSSGGAVICGWKEMGRCWVPVPGSSAAAPAPGASTFIASAEVSLPPGSGALSGSGANGLAQTVEPLTIYTVGFDVTAPAYTATLTNGMHVIGLLPPDLGAATDDRSGVDADGGVVVTLANAKIPVRYDADRRRIQVTDRTIPDEVPDGPAELSVRINDGFCNATSATFAVVVVRGSRIHLPYSCKRCTTRP